jgi:hypothetical protein
MPDAAASSQLSSAVVAEEKRLRNTRYGLLAPGILTIFFILLFPETGRFWRRYLGIILQGLPATAVRRRYLR